MFKVGKTYMAPSGQKVRIISVDSNYHHGAFPCPILGEVTNPGRIYPNAIYGYDVEGNYCGNKTPDYKKHSLISDEPTAEEAEIIRDIRDLMEKKADDDIAFVKVLRQLRK